MGFLTQSSNPAFVWKYTGLNIQTSSSAVPITILYGTNRLAPNAIWTGGFYAVPQYQKGGGKGGGNGPVQGYTYYTSFLMGLCEGPLNNYDVTFLNQQYLFGLYGPGWSKRRAAQRPQTPWGYLQAFFPGQALGYNGLAYVGAYNYNLGSSPNLPQFSFVLGGVTGVGNSIWDGNVVTYYDSDPALIIQDFLTNAQYGVLFPAASIDATTLLARTIYEAVTITIAAPAVVTYSGFTPVNGMGVTLATSGALPTGLQAGVPYYMVGVSGSTSQLALTPNGTPINTSGAQSGTQTIVTWDSSYQTYCRASFLALSPCLTNQEAANSILARWLRLTNTAAVWSGGKLKFIPYGDTLSTGPVSYGYVTFNPNVTPIYNLTDDDFIHEDGKDPLEVVRSDPYASYNWQRLQINARVAFYDAVPIDAWDQNAIELYGLRRASDITASEICDVGVGQVSAQLILQRGLYIRNTYNFKLSFEYCLLEPMDLVTVTDPLLGLNNAPIRITAIEEDDAGVLAVTAEEFPGGTATAVQYPVQPKLPNSTNQAVVPARVNTPTIFEPPAALTGGVAQVWAAVSGGVASVYSLAETSASGVHSTSQTMVNTQASGNTILFSVYVQAVTRTAVRLNGNNGSANIGCDFNLATGTAGTPDAGIAAATIAAAGGGQSAPVTISIGSPAVVTWAANGLVSGQAVYFTTTGSLPTGLTPNTIYYAIPAVPAGNTFNVALTPGGAAINTTGSQSGAQTGIADIWFQISISFAMAALATPAVTVILENPYPTQSYAGTAGDGINIWSAEYGWTNAATGVVQAPTFLPAFSAVSNATLATNGAATPEGVAGVADPNWGGAFVWISTDNTTYGQIGTVLAPSARAS
jgi:hypothetical protein